jgi:hypothetical protein
MNNKTPNHLPESILFIKYIKRKDGYEKDKENAQNAR